MKTKILRGKTKCFIQLQMIIIGILNIEKKKGLPVKTPTTDIKFNK